MNKIILAFIVVLIGLGVWSMMSTSDPAETGPELNERGNPIDQQYESGTYGFSFTYPGDLVLEVSSSEFLTLQARGSDASEAQVEVRVVEAEAPAVTSESAFMIEQVRLLCDADGPEGSVRCPAVDFEAAFVSDYGVSGTVLMLEQEMIGSDGAADDMQSVRGPFYAFPLESGTEVVRMLLVHVPIAGHDALTEPLVEMVARSVQFE